MKQARSKRRDSEATTDSIASTPETDNSARSSRRSRVPKRFHDDEYTPPAAKRRLVQSTRTSISSDAENLIASRAPSRSTPVPRQNTPSTNSIAQSKPKGRPKKVGRKKKEKEPWEEEVEDDVVVTYDSDHESDEDFPSPSKEYEHDIEEEEEDLLLEVKPEVFADEPAQSSIWVELDQETIPKLELPESSEDLPLPKNAIMDSIEIYDILRSYHRTLRLTPFAYEDFLAGLISKTNSCIMAEIHMCLLRVCLKSDDEEQTHFSVSDTNTGVNVYIHSMDQMTYAEILRLYIEAYPGVDSSVLDAINTDNYPYVSYEPKIVVLLFMCYRFLYSSEYRKLISNVGKFQNDDSCRVCGKSNGRIVGCSRCDASFHPECSCLDPFPDVLVCNLCTQNSIRGVADSLSFDETVDREPIRLMPIGRDRHGRIYWFIARRIFVQTHDDTELRYYTTAPQYYNLLKCLDPIFYEKELCDFLKEKFNMILEQMTITIEMSMDRRDSQMEQFAQKNSMTFRYDLISQNFPVMYLDRDNMRQIASILNQSSIEYALKNEIKQEDQEGHTLPPVKSEVEFDLSLIGIHQGRLINTFWCGGATEEELIQYFGNQINDEIVHEEHWRMGDVKNDHEFMKYVNYYSNNDMAESFQARKKIADKRKYISTKFCVMEDAPYNFQWGTSQNNFINGDSSIHAENLRFVISKLATNVPVELMHRRWPEQATKFKENLKRANTHGKLAHCLLQLDCALRKTLFVAQWWNGLGQLKFQRNTIEQREQQSKELQRVKKLESDALSKELDEKFIKVNYTRTNSPNFYILRQKGESYRNAGPNEMGGWKWISSKYSANTKERAQLPIIPILDEDSNLVIREDETIANRKAKKLHSLIGLIQQRKQDAVNREEDRQRTAASFSFARNCYSPSCNRQNTRRSVCADGDKGIVQSCYSVNCRNNFGKYCLSQSERKAKVNDVIGEGRAWKIPEPFDFMSNGVRNIFVVEKKIIRKLVKTAGRTMVYIPGFSTTAKMNTTVWNYPAPRPCFDLCWRWNTLNAHSLHAVALQLKLLWISIRWNEMEPEDKHPDRRVVIDMPTHDERRRIISHKEMGPFGQYERYLLEIEIIPLHNDEVEEDDEAWSSKKEREKMVARTSSRKRKQGGGKEIRKPRAIKKEWIDGVDLRLFEIKDYWKKYNEELSKYDQMKPAPLALHVVHVVPLNRPQQYNRVINTVPIQQTRLFPAPARNGGRPPTLEERNRPIGSVQMYNRGMPHRQNDKNPSPAYYPVNPSQAASNNFRTAATRPTPDYRYQQQPSTSRAVTGSEMPQRMSYVQGYSQNQFKARQYSNGYATPARMVPSAGRLVTQPIIRRIIPAPQRTAVVRSVGEPQHVEMRRMIVQQPSGGQLVEEAVAANTSDGDEQPPVIPRYDRNTVSVQEQPVEQARPVIRHTYTGTSTSQQPTLQRRMMGNNAVLIVKKAADGMIVRSHNGKDQLASAPVPGTIVAQQPKRLYSLKPVMGGQRQVMTAAGARVVRVAGPGEPIRRIIPNPNRTIQQDGEEIPEGVVQQRQFIVNPSQIRKTNVVPRGGATMQTAQQPQPMVNEGSVYQQNPDAGVMDIPFEYQ